jgi:hypothetical protein
MTRHLCVILSVAALASINSKTAATEQRFKDFSGIYSLLPDRSVATDQRVYSPTSPPESTLGRTVAGACGDQFTITQTGTLVTIRVVSGQTAARQYNGVSVDGTYELDHSATEASNGYTASLSQRGAMLRLTLTQYSHRSRPGRYDYVFRLGKDDTLIVDYVTNSGAYDVLKNASFRSITSVYQKSAP